MTESIANVIVILDTINVNKKGMSNRCHFYVYLDIILGTYLTFVLKFVSFYSPITIIFYCRGMAIPQEQWREHRARVGHEEGRVVVHRKMSRGPHKVGAID